MKKVYMTINTALVLVSLVILSGCNNVKKPVKENWLALKSMKQYPMSAYHLKAGIEYFEIRQYASSSVRRNGRFIKTPYSPTSFTVLKAVYKKPLNSFSKKTVKSFKALAPIIDKDTNIKISKSFGRLWSNAQVSNVFSIDKQENTKIGKTTKDVLELLGTIDTPAEAQMVLWLHNKPEGKSYRKVSNGFEVTIMVDNNYAGKKEGCGLYKYQALITKNGKLASYLIVGITRRQKIGEGKCIVQAVE